LTGPSAAPVPAATGALAPALVGAALSDLSDALAAASRQFADMADDETVVVDIATIAAMLFAGPLAPVAEQLAPAVVAGVFAIIENNQSARPGALSPIASGERGSNPWREREDDSR
jgi:hypothetical protein